MPNPLHKLKEKLPRAAQFVTGLAADFWKDGPEDIFARGSSPAAKAAPAAPSAALGATPTLTPQGLWHAQPGEISEKMWGHGYVQPGDAALSELMISPLGLNKDHSVLDLSAGLGGRLRKVADDFQVYVTGLEPDPQIAARGMEISIATGKGKRAAIATYDPANFSVARNYDCILARETFYRVEDRVKLFTALGACAKPKAQVSFTDYIVNPEDRDKPGIKAWMEFEKGANPASLVELAEAWAKAGFNLRVHDDQTAFYVKEVSAGVKRLAAFLATAPKPDAETKAALRRRVETWMHRLNALSQGMKFYRFYGGKQ